MKQPKATQLLLWLIPPILRKKTHVKWLNVLLTPLHRLYEDILYQMQHTGQVIYLEKVLNETFNPIKNYNPNLTTKQKRLEELIYIDESVKPALQYLYLHKEYYKPDGTLMIPQLKIFTHTEYKDKPVYLPHRKDYTQINYANFRVFIPESLIANRSITVQSGKNQSVQTVAVNVANMEYHNLLNFYKLAGKSYETYSYSAKD